MPRYSYKCLACENVFDIFHSMSEEIEKHYCEQCAGEQEVKKVPASFFSFEKSDVGKVVREHIRSAKEELKEQRKGAIKEYVDDSNTSAD